MQIIFRDDSNIIKGLQNGDDDAYRYVYEHYAKLVHYILKTKYNMALELDDVIQEVMLRIYNSIDSFTYRENGSFKCWLGLLAERVIIDLLRKKQASKRMVEKAVEKEQATMIEENRRDDVSLDILEILPSLKHDICVLKYEFGYKCKEIAKTLNIDYSKVQQEYKAAVKILREAVQNETRNKAKGSRKF